MVVHTPLSAGKVILSLKKGSDWVPYDERNLDEGGLVNGDEYGKAKAYLQFPDYDAMLAGHHQFQAGKLVERILKGDIKRGADAKIAQIRGCDGALSSAPLVYNMLYKGSADTRTGATEGVSFKLSATEAGSGIRTILICPHITGSGVTELTGNGEHEFNIVVNNVSAGESFAVAHVDGDQAFIQAYVILGQAKYILVRGALQAIKQELSRAKVKILPAFQRALRGDTSVAAAPPVSAPAVPSRPPSPVSGPEPDAEESSEEPNERPVIPLSRLSPEAFEHPLVKNDMCARLLAFNGDQWIHYGRVRAAFRGSFGGEKLIYFRNLLLRKGMYHHNSLAKNRYEALETFLEYFLDGMKSINDASEPLLWPFFALRPGKGGCMAWDLSDRLGLPLVKVTAQLIALPQEAGEVKALSLPLVVAENIDGLIPIAEIPIAVLSIGPNGWQRAYDYTPNASLVIRSFPSVSGIGSPLLRAVLPQRAMATATSQVAKDACRWYALVPDLLTRLQDDSLQVVCFFAIHSHGLEMHLTLLQRMSPLLGIDLAGARLLELRYLAKICPAIQEDDHYRAFLRILNLAHHDHVYYEYNPSYYWDSIKGEGDRRFAQEWHAQENKQDQHGQYKPIPYIIPYVQQIVADGDDVRTVYYDFFASKKARKGAGKATDLGSMQDKHEKEDVLIKMEDKKKTFEKQWTGGIAYQKLREMKKRAIAGLSNSSSVKAQMADLDWWEYCDQLCNARMEPAFGREFKEVLTEAVQPEER
jgi:hypothetical protein